MSPTRRDFLRSGATAAAAAALATAPRPLLAHLGGPRFEPVPLIDDPRLKALAARALEAARAAGAAYADVRLTHTWQREIDVFNVRDYERITVGTRALVNGYWGFAASPVWSPDEMARLGAEAVHQAKANALGKPRSVDLAPISAVSGHWDMPVKFDPYEVHPLEIIDHLWGLELFTRRTPRTVVDANSCNLVKQEKAFASSAGSYLTQRTYRTAGSFQFRYGRGDRHGGGFLHALQPAGVGWEHYRDQPLKEHIRRKIEELEEDFKLPLKPVEVGRYDVLFDAPTVATLVHGTLRPATELDRALGYEANAGGTSYLNEPFEMLGSYQVGAPLLTVTGNRSEPGGSATVKWDDEGVAPEDFTIVRDGILVDFQTTRESAGWLRDYYAKAGKPLRSHGCAAAPEAVDAPLQHSPNLTLAPGRESLDYEGLAAGVTKGLAICDMGIDMDFQGSSGLGMGRTYEIKSGKRVAILQGAGVLFRSADLWRGLLGLGGRQSLRRFGGATVKGEPPQEHFASFTAPPALFKQLTVVDALRKA